MGDPHYDSYLKFIHETQFHDSGRPTSEIASDLELRYQTKQAKKRAVSRRRKDFDRNRDMLLLKMLSNGTPYVCCHPDCEENRSLEVDHKIPLMCRLHNSRKGDKKMASDQE